MLQLLRYLKPVSIFTFTLISLFIWAIPAVDANTITYSEGTFTLTISGINSDWTWTDTFPTKLNGIRVHSIRFNPGAANDRCIINAGSVSGGDLFDSSVATDSSEGSIQYYPSELRLKPVLDVSDGTYNASAKVTIIVVE